MNETAYETKEQAVEAAMRILHKRLRQVVPPQDIDAIEARLTEYRTNRKGYLGDLVEHYVFGLQNNGRAEADLAIAGVEIKSTPLKRHAKRRFVAKERLVFSMIDYKKVVEEDWETSSFLNKNKLLLILFYLYMEGVSILDYEFEFVHLLDLMKDIGAEDIAQIRKDWEFIVNKIRRGEAHLLSEADTYYLGACTKARSSAVVRDQPASKVPAKPRAFSLKQSYLNNLIQRKLLGRSTGADSIYAGEGRDRTIEEVVGHKLGIFMGKTISEIEELLHWHPQKRSKNLKRLLVNRILTGTGSNRIEELEKADVTLRAVTLNSRGSLRESISFPAFDYVDLAHQVWYDEKTGLMSDFHAQLETKRFLFVVFQEDEARGEAILKGHTFWNFPMADLPEAEAVFDKTIACIVEGTYADLPKISQSRVAHIRPHGRKAIDTSVTPQGTREPKRCFWLNAGYIAQFLPR